MRDSCGTSPKNLPLYLAEQWYRSLFIEKEGSDIFKVLLSDMVNFKLIKERELEESITVDIQSQSPNEGIRKKQATIDSILNEIKENASYIVDIFGQKNEKIKSEIMKDNISNTYASEVLGKNANECNTKQEIKAFQMFSNIYKIINLQK